MARATAQADSTTLQGLLRRAGLHAVGPTAAADFTLTDLHGTRVMLSAQQGHWVLLTFFATWCGPCASEMPGLEALHQARQAAGWRIIAVAVDAADGGVPAYAQAKKLTFPVLLDNDGAVAGRYRASSIPTSYLIDPAGQLVAVSRGARDWTRQTDFVDGLLALGQPTTNAAATPATRYAQDDKPVELPATLSPPTATVELASAPQPGKPFDLQVHVRWAGTLTDYVLHPPEVHLPDGVTLLGTAASTSSATDRLTITYQLQLVAAEPGTYALDPVELRYTPAGEDTPQSSRIAGLTVTVAPPSFLGLRWQIWAGLGASLLAIAAGAHLLWHGWLKHRIRAPRQEGASTHFAEATLQLTAARQARLDGDPTRLLECLLGLTPESETGAHSELVRLFDGARYGGHKPGEEVLDRLLRAAARYVQGLAPDPQNGAEQRINLVDSSEKERT